ncbi:molybdenum cofactor guanylyltransferase [Acetonema longum]|uniref:Probable molybdenum cofactor guanylyltransferase n=1 Tax=Acetonema longum DSM 6540 TaxID=1009370 RepID=F7NF28_9FIRM|nr:molybdenum cofactor guanylyltransferase [Acetonema longum]EGO65355.1 formate dehydrogenase accessory protein FdhD [Acetonema longum DSM 6540]
MNPKDSTAMKPLAGIVPVILAGGKSSRMGWNKSLAIMGGARIIEIVAGKVSGLFSAQLLLVTNTPDVYRYLGMTMVSDIFTDMGPLAGIHAALRHTTAPGIFVCGCDMPFISEKLIRHMAGLAQDYDVVVPRQDSARPEPLHAIYSRRCLEAIGFCLTRGQRRIAAFFPEVSVRYIDEAEIRTVAPGRDIFLNINTPAELEKGRKLCSVGDLHFINSPD